MTSLESYDYDLPKELIAQFPLKNRADARLLIADRKSGAVEHTHIRDLPEILRASDTLVFNDTRVIPARLVGRREQTGGRWFGLFEAADEQGNLRLLCKTRGLIKPGETVVLDDRQGREAARLVILAKLDDGRWAVRPDPPEEIDSLLARVGRVPLPHYIRGGEMVDADVETYQTVFADHPGAVAAPTAGLHFTRALLGQLAAAGVGSEKLTLHVGTGTFQPIKAGRLEEHAMHAEWGRIEPAAAERLNGSRAAGGRLVAVGTTTVRLLESAASKGTIQPFAAATDLFIRPPFHFQAVDALLTNFHLPRSTLLVLVRTFGGEELIRRAYAEAIRERYRFFSYGDAMLIT